LIDRHPKYIGLVLAVGGSGNGFMKMLAVGVLVADASEGAMKRKLRKMLRWRPKMAAGRGWRDTQDRFGADRKVMNFQDARE
jgi:sarcosine oxidase / L-pipecolate oxidase